MLLHKKPDLGCRLADDHCLQTLYPPGTCGTYCNQHTYDCYRSEITGACCSEAGHNCEESHDVPNTCPVGCAVVFPAFVETCRDHIHEMSHLDESEFEQFASDCMEQDGLALVEYAISLQDSGCILDLGDGSGRRRAQYLSQWFGASEECRWDDLNGLAQDVDMICCGRDGCPQAEDGSVSMPETCNAACAIAMHTFTSQCDSVIAKVLGGDRADAIAGFEQTCLDSADSHLFLEAIMGADCSNANGR